MANSRLAVIGLGNMGGAIIHGAIDSGAYAPSEIYAYDSQADKRKTFAALGLNSSDSAVSCVSSSEAVLIAVKPQNISALLDEISSAARGKLIITIAAGVAISTIEAAVPDSRVIRVMPNTPLLVSEGVSAIARGKNATDSDFSLVNTIFSSAGKTLEVTEALLDPITALTSSSVAYFARVIGDMKKWAMGTALNSFSEKELTDMIAHVAIGSAKLLIEKGMTSDELIRAVTSPGGTTEQANRVFDEKNLTGVFAEAMTACFERAVELSRKDTE